MLLVWGRNHILWFLKGHIWLSPTFHMQSQAKAAQRGRQRQTPANGYTGFFRQVWEWEFQAPAVIAAPVVLWMNGCGMRGLFFFCFVFSTAFQCVPSHWSSRSLTCIKCYFPLSYTKISRENNIHFFFLLLISKHYTDAHNTNGFNLCSFRRRCTLMWKTIF